jgi:hypothetical protein
MTIQEHLPYMQQQLMGSHFQCTAMAGGQHVWLGGVGGLAGQQGVTVMRRRKAVRVVMRGMRMRMTTMAETSVMCAPAALRVALPARMLQQPGGQRQQQHRAGAGQQHQWQHQQEGAGEATASSIVTQPSTSRMVVLQRGQVHQQRQQQPVAEAGQHQQQEEQVMLMTMMRTCMTSLLQEQPQQHQQQHSSSAQVAAMQPVVAGQDPAMQWWVGMLERETNLASSHHPPWFATQHLPTLAGCWQQWCTPAFSAGHLSVRRSAMSSWST